MAHTNISSNEETDPPYKVVDVFCGGGGLSLGLESPERLNGLADFGYDLGYDVGNAFETVMSIDHHRPAARTFRSEFPDANVFERDIHEIEYFTAWEDADIVVGGPPCGGFSNLSQTKTEELDDHRNKLWGQFFRVVEAINPDVFLIENVPRFLSAKEGRQATEHAEMLGYTTVVDTLWAHQYGVPQKRKRVFMLGSKLGVPFFPERPDEPTRTFRDAVDGLSLVPDGENYHNPRENVTEKSRKRMKHVPAGGNRTDIPKHLLPDCWINKQGGTDLFGRLWWDEPSVTIRTEFYKPEKGRYLHPSEDRSITVREAARLQTFPDDYGFEGSARNDVASQIGNAVPPKLAYHLGEAILAHLNGENSVIDAKADLPDVGLKKAVRVGDSKQSALGSYI